MTVNCTDPLGSWFVKPNMTNYTGMIEYVNCYTDNLFGASIPWLVFIVSFTVFATARYPPLKSIMASGYISWIVAILMALMGWTESYMVTIFGIITAAFTALVLWKEKSTWG